MLPASFAPDSRCQEIRRLFATLLEKADTQEAIGLNWSRLRSTRPVTVRGTPASGVPENVPVRAYQCLDWGVSRSRPSVLMAKSATEEKENAINIEI